jgi:PQQ-like domain
MSRPAFAPKLATFVAAGFLAVILTPAARSAPNEAHPATSSTWIARYSNKSNSTDIANAIGVSPDGTSVFVTGLSTGSGALNDYATVAYDATTGAQRWVARYDGPGHSDDVASSLGISPDGSTVFVTGYSMGADSTYGYATIAYDASSGTQHWVARHEGQVDIAYPPSLKLSPDGAVVYVAGNTSGSGIGADWDYETLAYDAVTGSQLWSSSYDGPDHNYDAVIGMGLSPDGSTVFVTGISAGIIGNPLYDAATVAYDTTSGMQRWLSRYNGPASFDDVGWAIGLSPDGGSVFVTGNSRSNSTAHDYITLRYDATTGAQRWVARYTGPNPREDYAYALGVSPDGLTVFVTGESSGDYATVAYGTTDGVQQWASRYDGPLNAEDHATDLEVSPDGLTVVVTGFSLGANGGYDYATATYEAATGVRDGVVRGLGPGAAVALQLAPDGTAVFVTGSVGAAAVDYGTVAYALNTGLSPHA